MSAALFAVAAVYPAQSPWLEHWRAKNPIWRGIQLSIRNDRQGEELRAQLPKLAARGVNVLVLEIDYDFAFDSYPQLRAGSVLTKPEARTLAGACRARGIRPIPLFNCLGHQSWAKTTGPLLKQFPPFDETPGQFPENKGIYCRSWCPQHPGLNRVVFSLIDEIADAFQADAFHCGMDEVFLIGSEYCPRCRGENRAKLFAKAVGDLHQHLVKERGLEMLIWSDRLLDNHTMRYSKWEASENGTAPAIDHVPKDLILCDWHYEKRPEYPSVPFFLKHGFRVWPSSWKKPEAAAAFADYARAQRNPRVVGQLCTTWSAVKISELADWPALRAALGPWHH